MICTLLPLTPQTVKAASDGFYTSGTSVYDANGNKFIMRGVNIAHAWYSSETDTSIKAAASKGANCVRIVCSNGKQYTKTSASELQHIIDVCKQNKVVCIVEVHDATGSDSTSDLNAAVDYWKEMKSILSANKKYVIVNIANSFDGSSLSDWGNTLFYGDNGISKTAKTCTVFTGSSNSSISISESGSANGHRYIKCSYDNCVSAFGTSDFSGKLDQVHVSAKSGNITVYSVCYIY